MQLAKKPMARLVRVVLLALALNVSMAIVGAASTLAVTTIEGDFSTSNGKLKVVLDPFANYWVECNPPSGSLTLQGKVSVPPNDKASIQTWKGSSCPVFYQGEHISWGTVQVASVTVTAKSATQISVPALDVDITFPSSFGSSYVCQIHGDHDNAFTASYSANWAPGQNRWSFLSSANKYVVKNPSVVCHPPNANAFIPSIEGENTFSDPQFEVDSGAQFLLRNSNSAGAPNLSIIYGLATDRPVDGDWDGDGKDTIGFYRNGDFYLRNSNSKGAPDLTFSFANPGDLPVAGDWNGDGSDSIGVYRPSTGDFFLRDKNSGGPAEYVFSFGNFNDTPLAGDWNGDGIDSIGVYRPSTRQFFLSNSNAPGPPDYAFDYGNPGDLPVAGDWAGDGADRIGLFRPSNQTWYLERYNLGPATTPEWVFAFGTSASRPIAGDWDDNGTDTPGAVQP